MNNKAKETVDRAINELSQQLDAGKSEVLREYLDCMSKFHQYSWCNVLLIGSQMPEATFVAGYRKWKQMNRFVKKGEKGIAIVAPMLRRRVEDANEKDEADAYLSGFRIVHVFNVSQTEGEPLPTLSKPHGELGHSLKQLEALVRGDGITLSYESLPAGSDGYSANGRIGINERLGDLERFVALVHELAHEWLGHHSQHLPQSVRETEAEAIAYVVCRACGVEAPGSSEYIQLYRGSSKTLGESLARIQKTSARIIDGVSSVPKHAISA